MTRRPYLAYERGRTVEVEIPRARLREMTPAGPRDRVLHTGDELAFVPGRPLLLDFAVRIRGWRDASYHYYCENCHLELVAVGRAPLPPQVHDCPRCRAATAFV